VTDVDMTGGEGDEGMVSCRVCGIIVENVSSGSAVVLSCRADENVFVVSEIGTDLGSGLVMHKILGKS